jgi:hypothetical protein
VESTDRQWIVGTDLWRAGFHISALSAISRLSGLVEILDAHWIPEKMVLMFTLKSLDQTGTLFGPGGLLGSRVEKFQITDQPLIVDLQKENPYMNMRR